MKKSETINAEDSEKYAAIEGIARGLASVREGKVSEAAKVFEQMEKKFPFLRKT